MTTEVGGDNRVREMVRLLTELQDIDDELKDISLERGDLPEEVERLQAKLGEFETFITQRKVDLEDATRKLAERVLQHDAAKDKLLKYTQQLYAVKTTREYDAVTAEVNFAKQEITTCEKEMAALTARKSELTRVVDERLSELEKVRVEEKAKAADLAEKLAETEAEERQLLHRRENVVVRIMKPLYAHYERIRKVKDGRGVAKIFDNACGGCFAVIPPQTQVNIRKQLDIVLCETCGRIIVP